MCVGRMQSDCDARTAGGRIVVRPSGTCLPDTRVTPARPAQQLLRVRPKETKMRVHENVHECSRMLDHNRPDPGNIKVPDGTMNELRHPHSGTELSNEKEQATQSNAVQLNNISERIQFKGVPTTRFHLHEVWTPATGRRSVGRAGGEQGAQGKSG